MAREPSREVPISARELVVGVSDKFPERDWNADSWEEVSKRWVDSPRETVCWVFPAGDVACDKKALVRICKVVDAPEYLVSLPVSAFALPPTLDNSFIVSKDPEVLTRLAGCGERACKKLKANGLSPPDVSAVRFPTQEEFPRSPSVADYNADAKT